MDKIAAIVNCYEPILHHCLPPYVKQRAKALRKLHLEKINVELEYHRELQELELKYAQKYEVFHEKRAKIVSGEYQPTDDDCKLPESLQDSYNDSENMEFFVHYKLTKEEEKEVEDKIKGIPHFWLCVLLTSPTFNDSIEDHDKAVLKYLRDVRVSYNCEPDDQMSHTIKFVFDKNPYFTNEFLTKKYTLSLKVDKKDPFSFEGYELVKIEGCKIDWISGKDVTTQTVNTKQKNKHDGSKRVKSKQVERDSFFHFFTPPLFPEPEKDSDSCLASLDFEMAEILRQNIIPKAGIYYTGDILDDDDEDDDDEDDDEEDDDDDDDEDVDDDIDAEESDLDDSLDEEDGNEASSKWQRKGAAGKNKK